MPVSPFDRNNYTPSAPSAPSTATASSDTGVSKSKKRRAPPPPGVAAPRDSSPGQSARPLLVVMSVPFHWSSCRSRPTGLHVGPVPLVFMSVPFHWSSCQSRSTGLHVGPFPLVFVPVLTVWSACQTHFVSMPILFMPVLLRSSCQSSLCLHANSLYLHAGPLLVSMPVICWSSYQSFTSGLHASPSLLVSMPVILYCS